MQSTINKVARHCFCNLLLVFFVVAQYYRNELFAAFWVLNICYPTLVRTGLGNTSVKKIFF